MYHNQDLPTQRLSSAPLEPVVTLPSPETFLRNTFLRFTPPPQAVSPPAISSPEPLPSIRELLSQCSPQSISRSHIEAAHPKYRFTHRVHPYYPAHQEPLPRTPHALIHHHVPLSPPQHSELTSSFTRTGISKSPVDYDTSVSNSTNSSSPSLSSSSSSSSLQVSKSENTLVEHTNPRKVLRPRRATRQQVVTTLSDSSSSSPSGSDSDRVINDGQWTEEEHQRFLLGLEKCGKGKWRTIADEYVRTRTRIQVASHAQKYYKKLARKAKKQAAERN